jgi:hypothetical protein
VAEAEAGEDAGAVILDHHVDGGGEAAEGGLDLRVADVEEQGALVAGEDVAGALVAAGKSGTKPPSQGTERNILKQVPLDKLPGDVKVHGMPLSWKSLRSDLKALTRARGEMSALARERGVSRQAGAQWLSGKTTPSSEMMIQLFNWADKRKLKAK